MTAIGSVATDWAISMSDLYILFHSTILLCIIIHLISVFVNTAALSGW